MCGFINSNDETILNDNKTLRLNDCFDELNNNLKNMINKNIILTKIYIMKSLKEKHL